MPLLVSSLISGIGSLDVIAKIGLRTGVYYLSTTALACVQGFVFVFAIQPEANVTLPVVNTDTDHNYTTIDGILDLIRYKTFSNRSCISERIILLCTVADPGFLDVCVCGGGGGRRS